MKRFLPILLLSIYCTGARAWNYSETMNSISHSAQLRLGADVHWRWKSGLGLSLDEDLRFDMVNSTSLETTAGTTKTLLGPDFNKSYTTTHSS